MTTSSPEQLSQDAVLVDGGKYFVDAVGNYLGQFVGEGEHDLPEGTVEVPFAPDVGDQVWDFVAQSYGPSLSRKTAEENAWRLDELNGERGVPYQIAMVEDDDTAAVGTVDQWRSYRKELRLWVDTNPDFPFGTRPARPQE